MSRVITSWLIVTFSAGVVVLGAEQPPFSGDLITYSKTLDQTVTEIKDGYILMHRNILNSPGFPIIRPSCHSCPASYNLFHTNETTFVPNTSAVYVLKDGSQSKPYSIDLGDCNPVGMHSVRGDRVWVQCSIVNRSLSLKQLDASTSGQWVNRNSLRFQLSSSAVSHNGVMVRQQNAGVYISYLYYGNGARLDRRGLEDSSFNLYSKPKTVCSVIENLFLVGEHHILIQCQLRGTPEGALVLFDRDNPSTNLVPLEKFDSLMVQVYTCEEFVAIKHSSYVKLRSILADPYQLISFHDVQLHVQGLFVKADNKVYFVCSSKNKIYVIDVAEKLKGSRSAEWTINLSSDICVDIECDTMKAFDGILFVPVRLSPSSVVINTYYMETGEFIRSIDEVIAYRYNYSPEARNTSTGAPPTLPISEIQNDTIADEETNGNAFGSEQIVGISLGGLVLSVLLAIVVVGIIYYMRRKHPRRRYYQYMDAVAYVPDEQNDNGVVEIVPGQLVMQPHRGHGRRARSRDSLNQQNEPIAPLNNTTVPSTVTPAGRVSVKKVTPPTVFPMKWTAGKHKNTNLESDSDPVIEPVEAHKDVNREDSIVCGEESNDTSDLTASRMVIGRDAPIDVTLLPPTS